MKTSIAWVPTYTDGYRLYTLGLYFKDKESCDAFSRKKHGGYMRESEKVHILLIDENTFYLLSDSTAKSFTNMEESIKEIIRKRALDKLSEEEKIVLGLVETNKFS